MLSHLPPSSLSDVSLVSKRFHELVTTPHAWRIAFSRYFPGAEALSTPETNSDVSDDRDGERSERRLFTRLTALASWRSEYFLRTRLVRSLARGRPAELDGQNSPKSSRSNVGNAGNAQITYNSNLTSTVNRLHANFGTGQNKKLPRFVHGASDLGAVSTSDFKLGKVDSWGFTDNVELSHFTETYVGYAQYGLGGGDLVGVPNPMDVSQHYGMICGEGLPEGQLYYRHMEEKRGRVLVESIGLHMPDHGIPDIASVDPICTWIAKSPSLPDLSEGMIGLLCGSSNGVITAYSVGTNGMRDRRFERGEMTARWILSPGVPIIAIAVDDDISSKRLAASRIWAVVLNALGEVYYLTELPKQTRVDGKQLNGRSPELSRRSSEILAWETGRSVHWTLVEPTRRVARVDPFDRSPVDGSYSPRSSWDGMHLSWEQLVAETREIETFLVEKPKHFRQVCFGWDMRRGLEVDFAASDEHRAGENIVVIDRGLDEGHMAEIKRYTRCKFEESSAERSSLQGPQGSQFANGHANDASLFGSITPLALDQPTWSFGADTPKRRNSTTQSSPGSRENLIEDWHTSNFSFGGLKAPQITAATIDSSKYATLTIFEDPLLSMTGFSVASSPMSSPLGEMPKPTSPSDIPGQRARFIAIGTKTGTIILWNMRAPSATDTILQNTLHPIRVINTTSPQISCLALTALYLVHGGNDGLVQFWDPLASTTAPIRTLNSRFSSRARRRLVQAEASPEGVGINLFAAGALCLDADPTILRGIVSLGSHLRYWSYSSLATDQYKGSKRRPRRSEPGSNQGGDRFSGTGRGALKEYIANEKLELEREKRKRAREEERLAGRFGVDLLGPGASEEEMLAYATILSAEAARSDELRRKSPSEDGSEAVGSPVTSIAEEAETEVDDDVAEATRLSLRDDQVEGSAGIGEASFPTRFASKKKASPKAVATASASREDAVDDDDLEYALQLSLAEQASQMQGSSFAGGESKGKGKGREL